MLLFKIFYKIYLYLISIFIKLTLQFSWRKKSDKNVSICKTQTCNFHVSESDPPWKFVGIKSWKTGTSQIQLPKFISIFPILIFINADITIYEYLLFNRSIYLKLIKNWESRHHRQIKTRKWTFLAGSVGG